MYGVPINRAGMTCCIFHEDHTPSMKIDKRFHCFGCGADGDVIDFTARLFDLTLNEAAEKLANDFHIQCDRTWEERPPVRARKVVARRSLVQRLKNYQNENYRMLCSYSHLLTEWQKQYEPKPEDEKWHPLFIEAIQNTARVEYLLDELQGCTAEKAREIISGCKNELARYAGRVREFMPRHRRNTRDLAR